MKHLPLCALILLACTAMSLRAQEARCDVDGRLSAIKETEAYKNAIQIISDHADKVQIRNRAIKWIPVVVHDVDRTNNPLSRAQVIHQIDVMNQDFAGRGQNIHRLSEEFESLVADTEIRFCLANEDPDGMPHTGITYTETDIVNIALQRDINGRYVVYYDILGGKSGWNPQRYLNIWVAEYGNGILGYGSLPGTAPFEEETGIVMDRNFFGSVGSGASSDFFNHGHTLTHEVGHFLGLLHIWGDDEDSCDDSDAVEDTPNAEGPYTGCPSGVQTSCGVSNMYQNFMDFTDDRCLAAFTHGQAARMHATLDLFYPELAESSSCIQPVPASSWWEDLVWTYDVDSDQYVIYHPGGFAERLTIEIFALDGRLIDSEDVVERQSYLFIQRDFIPGIYMLRLLSGDHQFVRKFAVY